ncbi:MAG: efflux RND transporter periplasmic adaptor subunit [Pirellulales bacterium]|nr:efflux RND transporter periplasmic adaptor subunit [Pirellulales bacterium]
MRTLLWIVLGVGLIAAGGAVYMNYVSGGSPQKFRTAKIKREDLVLTKTATGTVEPEDLVDVGAQVVGRIVKFGPDRKDPAGEKTVDFNSVVRQGDLLACIDDTLYKGQYQQAEAALTRARVDLGQMKAKLLQAQHDLNRAKKLREANERLRKRDPKLVVISDADYDLAVVNYETAKANVGAAEAEVKQAEAALDIAKTNLGYTVIHSPVDGTIIARRVNIGQTVVASLNAPSLFLIAKDLRRMEVWSQVNEADIGGIKPEMNVQFTVDAYPDDVFDGKVSQIRLDAQTSQNVVIYTVVVKVDNSDLRLLPYMSANLHFEVERRPDVLQVPNLALQWEPDPEWIAPDVREKEEKTDAYTPGYENDSSDSAEKRGRLWIMEGMFVRPIEVHVGPSDGFQTEVSGKDVKEGMEVVVTDIDETAGADDTNNLLGPPKFFRSKHRQKRNQPPPPPP